MKVELKGLLTDPQERYNWRARRSTIVWDGSESLHVLASRIMRAIDRYDPKSNKEQEYFFRFREALPLEYRRAIDLGVAEDKCTIEEAKKVALRVQMATSDSGAGGTSAVPDKSVAFVGASMREDRLKAMELGLQNLSEKVDNLASTFQRANLRGRSHSRERAGDSKSASGKWSQYWSSERADYRDREDSRDDWRDGGRDDCRYSRDRRNEERHYGDRWDGDYRYDSPECRDGSYDRDFGQDHWKDRNSGYDSRSRYDDRDSDRRDDHTQSSSSRRDDDFLQRAFKAFCAVTSETADNKKNRKGK